MECKTPFRDFITSCPDGLLVNAHLTPNKNYQWLIEDKFDKQYAGPLTTDANGSFIIPVASLPAGLLTPFGGVFALQVLELYTAAPVQLGMKAFYDSIYFHVEGGSLVKENLGVL